MRLALAAGLFAACLPLVAWAQGDIDRDIVIAVRPGVQPREPIAVVEPRVTPPGNRLLDAAARELNEVLRDDLAWSGIFDLLPVSAHAQVSSPTTPQSVPWQEWVAVGARWLVHLDATVRDGELVVEGRLFETRSDRKLVLGKKYQAAQDGARRIAHTFADAVIGLVGGIPGVCTTQIAFASDRDGGRGRELWIMDYDGHGQRRLTGNGKLNLSPDFGPGNAEIAFTSFLGGDPDLYLLTRATGQVRPLIRRPGLDSTPSWSPDGSLIAFSSSFEDGDSEIYVIRPDGQGLRRLTRSRGIDTNPAWSPTGGEIAFTSDRSGVPHIWVMDADGLNPRRLSTQGTFNDGAAWAPKTGKDTRLAWAGRTAGSFQIFVYTFETGALQQLTQEGSNEQPSWSPDGRQIAFASMRGGRKDIYVMNDDGTNERRLTSAGQNVMAAWSRR